MVWNTGIPQNSYEDPVERMIRDREYNSHHNLPLWDGHSEVPVEIGSDNERLISEFMLQFGRDLVQEVIDGDTDPIVGRDNETEQVVRILSRKTKNNPVLIGEPGVGKTAIVEGLVQRIVSGNVPKCLKDKVIYSLDLGSLMSGTKMRGELEERAKEIFDELRTKKGQVILFIDEIHSIIGMGSDSGVDIGNMMKPFLSRGNMSCIGATTLDEFRKNIEKDSSFTRRFRSVMVDPPNVEDTINILRGLRSSYEDFHEVAIEDESIVTAANLSHRYISERFLPDKAIDLIDEACATSRINDEDDKIVGEDDIASVVSRWTGIPVNRMTEEEGEKILNLDVELHKRLVGQDEAVQLVSESMIRNRSGIKDPNRPIGSFIFLGPTGVGKTELAKTLAESMLDSEQNIIRVDMSEYMEKHSVSRMIGSPPGYVGHEAGGQLTEAVRRKPFSVILFDEIEKAHPDVFNVLLQVLDDGRITDGQGKTVDFKNTIIIMTSNIGSQHLLTGIGNDGQIKDAARDKVMTELQRGFRPEFLNRVDDIVLFKPLSRENIKVIVELLLNDIRKRLEDRFIGLEITEEAKSYVANVAYDPIYGARPLKRYLSGTLETKIGKALLSGQIKNGETITVTADVNGLIVQ